MMSDVERDITEGFLLHEIGDSLTTTTTIGNLTETLVNPSLILNALRQRSALDMNVCVYWILYCVGRVILC